MKKRLSIFLAAVISAVLLSCASATGSKNGNSCTFDSGNDQLIIKNQTENYELKISLYGNKLETGNYQVFGSDLEPLLEGQLTKDKTTCDVKTTLFIEYSGDSFKASGEAQLYKPGTHTKSGESLKFEYEGKLSK